MKRTLLPLLTVAASMTIIACGSDSGANAVPSPGNTSAILQPSDCEGIMKALPVQPELAYTATYDAEEDECVVVFPSAVDTSAIFNFRSNLGAYSLSLVDKGSKNDYYANMGILFHRSSQPNQFTFNLRSDCKNAAYVANIPEKDSTWEAEKRCDLFTKSNKDSYIYMTQPQWSERQAALTADGWMPIAKCNVSPFTGTICFQKQINDYIFELGYRPKEEDLMMRVKVVFEYQKI